MRLLLLTSLLIVGCAPIVHAQSLPALSHPSLSTVTSTSENSVVKQDDPIAKKLEETANRLALAEETNRLLHEQLKAKDDRIAAKDERIQNLNDRLALMTANRSDQNAIVTGDARMLASCENQLAKADAEIHRLRNPPFFKRLFSTEAVLGFSTGYGAASLRK